MGAPMGGGSMGMAVEALLIEALLMAVEALLIGSIRHLPEA